MTEPKYTRQDMITIISGNIEAWLGISAVHIYMFIEQLYNALVEAQIVQRRRPGYFGRWTSLVAVKSVLIGRRAANWRLSWIFGNRQIREANVQQSSFKNYIHRWVPSGAGRSGSGSVLGNHSSSSSGGRRGVCWFGLTFISGILVSILTKLKLKLAQLFAHISFIK